jgi:hypothetical protein
MCKKLLQWFLVARALAAVLVVWQPRAAKGGHYTIVFERAAA